MMQRAAAMVVVCLLPAAGAVEAAEAYAALPRTTKGLNLLVSGILAPDRERMPFGFLLGGGMEFPAPYGIDLNLGMSFQRLHSADGTVTIVSLIDATATKQAPTAVFFGAGLGPVFAVGNVRVGARMFGGVEFFHQRPVPIQVGLELIMKFCDEAPLLKCPAGEKQTWVAGRIGLRL